MHSTIRSYLIQTVTLAAAIFPAVLAAQPYYSVKDLGTLGGGYSYGLAINAAGEVTGYSLITGDTATHAFLYSRGRMLDLGTLGGTFSGGYGINNSGEVAGYSTLTGNNANRAFLYSHRRMINLGTLGGSSSYGRGINDSGQVVGYSLITGDVATHAFLYSRGRMIDLGTLGGTSSFATAINGWGEITGYSLVAGDTATHAFLYSDGTMFDLGAPDGASSFATAINVWGEVAGYFTIVGDTSKHAFLYSDGEMTELDTSSYVSEPSAINRWTQVVGTRRGRYEVMPNPFFFAGVTHGLLDLVGEGAGDMMYVDGINDAGQIVATGRYDGAFLLTPIPEPGSQIAGRAQDDFRCRPKAPKNRHVSARDKWD